MVFSLNDINWLAVIVAGVLYFLIGALWYSVLFTKPFIRYRGEIKPEDQGKPLDYALTFAADLLAAFVLALILDGVGAGTLTDAIVVGLAVAVGFAAASSFVYTIYSGPHKMLWVIYSGYLLVSYLVMSVLLTLWV
ncbi:MAG: DUF1761 domain-containing protein [Chloroflexi bacterium]|nr:DUF1761 domain-containing protein [Chloroflexota bacterium]